ncbi:glutamyl-tRNA reductase [Catalinimonas alkaloidigena]|uniref:Glutamyl-tRNA reductase n=1 Tax=Catalinimonas alkaloidigena TaxID=1075417 RepID=A0A1G9P8V0_9BACT|nr:glutamyl-tRNA reductase [Catalinimonas alkaloidigena]SDL94911.1 glutamyl-tRNA reductase [Catalinimonas alkaloidigena]
MQSSFKAISLSHKNASVELRERVALDEGECRRLLDTVKEITEVTELLILSTCNRTEIYYSSDEDYSTEIIKLLALQKGLSAAELPLAQFNRLHEDDEAARHLFRVALGLESMVVGDMQIINQVKRAYQWTADANLAGPFLHRLMHTIFFANKRVVQQTSFRDGAASVSYAAVELVEELTMDMAAPQVLILGVGEIGRDVCKNLENSDLKNIRICNRTPAKAEALAQKIGAEVVPFAQAAQAIADADVVISSISREEPFITRSMLAATELLTYKYFIDLSVPRSVAPDVEEHPGALVYNIDHIQNRATEALQQRIAAIPQVEEIMEAALTEFQDWSRDMIVSPTIQKLKGALEQIRQEELARHLKKMSEEEQVLVDRVTKGMMQKIIKLPVLQLKAACRRGEAETLIDVLNDLFNLEAQPTPTNDH